MAPTTDRILRFDEFSVHLLRRHSFTEHRGSTEEPERAFHAADVVALADEHDVARLETDMLVHEATMRAIVSVDFDRASELGPAVHEDFDRFHAASNSCMSSFTSSGKSSALMRSSRASARLSVMMVWSDSMRGTTIPASSMP